MSEAQLHSCGFRFFGMFVDYKYSAPDGAQEWRNFH